MQNKHMFINVWSSKVRPGSSSSLISCLCPFPLNPLLAAFIHSFMFSLCSCCCLTSPRGLLRLISRTVCSIQTRIITSTTSITTRTPSICGTSGQSTVRVVSESVRGADGKRFQQRFTAPSDRVVSEAPHTIRWY